jgi:hypothetical protein
VRVKDAIGTALAVGAGLVVGISIGHLDESDRANQRNSDILRVVDGDYMGGSLTFDEVGSLLPVYAASEQGEPCYMVTAALVASRDYDGYMLSCLGEEDSPAVQTILGGLK